MAPEVRLRQSGRGEPPEDRRSRGQRKAADFDRPYGHTGPGIALISDLEAGRRTKVRPLSSCNEPWRVNCSERTWTRRNGVG